MVHVLQDPVEYVRNHPQLFLRSGRVDGRELAEALVADALVLTDGPVTVERRNGWWIVGCESDWMTRQASGSVADLFHKIVPFPEAGPNSLHCEILLTAFADTVVISDERTVHPIQGVVTENDEICKVLRSNPRWKRGVAFRVPSP